MAKRRTKEQTTDTFQVLHAVHVERDPATMTYEERQEEIARLMHILYQFRFVVGKPLKISSENNHD